MLDYSSLLAAKDISEDELNKILYEAKRESKDALSKLCAYVYARLYSYVYYRVNHREDAEDLTSEVVLKVIKALKKQRGNFHAWIYRIAKNAIIDFYRHRAVRSEVSLAEIRKEIPDKEMAFADRILTQERLRKGLNKLTEEQRQVIILKFIDGYDNEEISKIIGKSIGSVKLLQFRALKSLREFFKKKGYET